MRMRVKGEKGRGYKVVSPEEDAAQAEVAREASPASLIKQRMGKEIIHVDIVDAETDEVLTLSVYRLQPGEIYMIDETIFTPALHEQIQGRKELTSDEAMDLTQETLGLEYRYQAIQKWKQRTIDIVYAALVDEELKDKAFLAEMPSDVLKTLCDVAVGRYTEANSVTRFPELDTAAGESESGAVEL